MLKANPFIEHLASMRPRLISRGNANYPPHGAEDVLASMRPRLISRGNVECGVWPKVRHPASMRPRLISRGNGYMAKTNDELIQGFNEAATDQSRKCHSVVGRLYRRHRFNEAATDQSRK